MASKKKSGDISWTAEEFSKIDLQDKHLNKRCQNLASDLEQQLTDPINQDVKIGLVRKRHIAFLTIQR